MRSYASSLLAVVAVGVVVPVAACIVNNNQSPGANGTVAPTVTIDPQVGVAMPGGSVQVNRTPPAASSAPVMVPAPPPP